ncbi:hypothetical protein [Thalassotalea sp. PP2-459]|uniref:hypothetical protein n=1 Tax=Thalassotalea sp. PP2-459 TaxID=1742724 RepID=UPI0009450B57|nr:hypothetical protein [Thalassotalea sp. PP2-459]OKY27758.1 hypothetical protein BI291_07530 [Thalassotalea sp. PP2-459]
MAITFKRTIIFDQVPHHMFYVCVLMAVTLLIFYNFGPRKPEYYGRIIMIFLSFIGTFIYSFIYLVQVRKTPKTIVVNYDKSVFIDGKHRPEAFYIFLKLKEDITDVRVENNKRQKFYPYGKFKLINPEEDLETEGLFENLGECLTGHLIYRYILKR